MIVLKDYELIDTGNGRKYERFGRYRLVRPAPGATWKPFLPPSVWAEADTVFERLSGKGRWIRKTEIPGEWTIDTKFGVFHLELGSGGNIGFFPEQVFLWTLIGRITEKFAEQGERPSVLNGFAHTGGSTLASALWGGFVCHVDSSGKAVRVARRNLEASGIDPGAERWIIDDVMKFFNRERKRGARYRMIILDPPSFGRGRRGEIWNIRKNLRDLVDCSGELIDPSGGMILLSCHTPGFEAGVLESFIAGAVGNMDGKISSGKISSGKDRGGRELPSGYFAVWADSDSFRDVVKGMISKRRGINGKTEES